MPYSLLLLGFFPPDRFDAERSEAHYRAALALAEPRGMRPLVAHCHLGLGKLNGRTGKREQAQEHLTAATTRYSEMGMTWLEQAAAAAMELGARDASNRRFRRRSWVQVREKLPSLALPTPNRGERVSCLPAGESL